MEVINIGTEFEPIQIPPQELERNPWASAGDPSKIDFKKLKDVEFPEVDLDVSVGWVIDCSFSAYNYRRVDWTGGYLTTADGTSYYINSGNTGNMSSVTYIYFSENSPNYLQTTTSASNSVGEGKILVAVASNVSSPKLAEFQVFGGKGSNQLITADNIAASTITANEIASNTIEAGNINVSKLSAISADLGTINAGTITGATIQTSDNAYSGVKLASNYGMRVHDQSLAFYSGSALVGWVYGDGALNINSSSGRNLVLDSGSNIVYFNCSARPNINSSHNLGSSSYLWGNVYTQNLDFGSSYYLNRSGSVFQLNNFTNIYIGGYTFRPVGFTFKDGSGNNRYIVVLATADPS